MRTNGYVWQPTEKFWTAGLTGVCLVGLMVGVSVLFSGMSEVSAWAKECEKPKVVSMGADPSTGSSQAVLVEGASLAHTAQMFPLDAQGQLVGPDNAEAQTRQVLANLQKALAVVGSGLEDLVRLEIHVPSASTTQQVRKVLAERFTGRVQPAVNWVLTPLPVAGALVSADAVAVVKEGEKPLRQRSDQLPGLASAAHVAVLPAGGVAYLSGVPEKGEPVAAAKKSLATLFETLGQMGLGPEHVVQVKVFLGPIEQAEAVQKELVQAWGKELAPPMTIVQWKSSAPVEIELVAADPPKKEETLEKPVHYYNRPDAKPSPRFSQATRVRSEKILYIGSLWSAQPDKGDAQVEAIFSSLEELLSKHRSDLRHLVKATYYCADPASSKRLDAIRSEKFDPKRPPAASKAMVSGVAIPDRSVVIDMIAVPTP